MPPCREGPQGFCSGAFFGLRERTIQYYLFCLNMVRCNGVRSQSVNYAAVHESGCGTSFHASYRSGWSGSWGRAAA